MLRDGYTHILHVFATLQFSNLMHFLQIIYLSIPNFFFCVDVKHGLFFSENRVYIVQNQNHMHNHMHRTLCMGPAKLNEPSSLVRNFLPDMLQIMLVV